MAALEIRGCWGGSTLGDVTLWCLQERRWQSTYWPIAATVRQYYFFVFRLYQLGHRMNGLMHEPLAKQTAARQKFIDDKAMDPFKPYTPSKRLAAGPSVRTAEDAQAVALKAVAFIAADDDLLPRFIALSGCDLDDIRQRIGDLAFLSGVLDFILADEPTLLAFVAAAELTPETPMAARVKLP